MEPSAFLFLTFLFEMQKGTIVEKLVEEVVKDGEHLRHLISICEGNKYSSLCISSQEFPSFLTND